MIDVVLRPVTIPSDGFALLAAEAREEGQMFVARLEDEWRSGSNRFSRPGEHFLGAYVGDRLAGVGGLNQDPYTEQPAVARLRHIYVRPRWRAFGVASLLTVRLIALAREERFEKVRLRTGNLAAARVYERHGFARAQQADASHEMALT